MFGIVELAKYILNGNKYYEMYTFLKIIYFNFSFKTSYVKLFIQI